MRFLLIAVLGLGAVIAYMYLGTGDAMSLSNEEKITRDLLRRLYKSECQSRRRERGNLDEGTNFGLHARDTSKI